MRTVVSPEQLYLSPGSVLRSPATWADYLSFLEQRGDRTLPRLKYRASELLFMSPILRHGRDANLLADFVKAILDAGDRDFLALTPITLRREGQSGIEPDYCFYIENLAAIAGRDRLDLNHDPPPDLAIEVDVTSYTDIADYLPFHVPEVWILQGETVVIYHLEGDRYLSQTTSRYAPNFDLVSLMDRCLEIAREHSSSEALREFRRNYSGV